MGKEENAMLIDLTPLFRCSPLFPVVPRYFTLAICPEVLS